MCAAWVYTGRGFGPEVSLGAGSGSGDGGRVRGAGSGLRGAGIGFLRGKLKRLGGGVAGTWDGAEARGDEIPRGARRSEAELGIGAEVGFVVRVCVMDEAGYYFC